MAARFGVSAIGTSIEVAQAIGISIGLDLPEQIPNVSGG